MGSEEKNGKTNFNLNQLQLSRVKQVVHCIYIYIYIYIYKGCKRERERERERERGGRKERGR